MGRLTFYDLMGFSKLLTNNMFEKEIISTFILIVFILLFAAEQIRHVHTPSPSPKILFILSKSIIKLN